MKKILIIEDTKSLRNAVIEILSPEGYTVRGAGNGREGLELAGEFLPDLIICDIMMPDIDGYGVLESLRQNRLTSAIPFIFITVKSDRKAQRTAMVSGADDYIIKPFSEKELLDAVKSQFEKQKIIKYRLESVTKERLTHLLSTCPAVIFSLNGSDCNRFTYISNNVASLLGYKPEDFLGSAGFWPGLIHQEDMQEVTSKIPCIFTEKHAVYKYRLLHRDGSYRWIYDERKLSGTGKEKEITGSWLDITELKKADELLNYRISLEELVSKISTSFINTPLSLVDGEINRALELTGKTFGADRCSIMLLSGRATEIECIYKWHSNNTEISPENFKPISIENPRWIYEQCKDRDYIYIRDLSHIPLEEKNIRKTFIHDKIRSFLITSMKSGRDYAGILELSTDKKETVWTKNDRRILRLLGEIFINILDKKRTEEELHYSGLMEVLITNISTRFIRFRSDSLDKHINHSLKAIGEFARAEKVFLYTFSKKKRYFKDIYEWFPEVADTEEEMKNFRETFFLLFRDNVISHEYITIPPSPESSSEKDVSDYSIAVPLKTDNKIIACFGLKAKGKRQRERDKKLLRVAGEIFIEVLAKKKEEKKSDGAVKIRERFEFHNIIGKSRPMQEVYHLIEDLADVRSTVLITGESGTGKELIAEAIHNRGLLRHMPLVKVNCSVISENLQESELFGHVKGAFTGAIKNYAGRFENASGGTIFLDEIGDISSAMQKKLLRVLQEKEFERVGEGKPVRLDVRVISATNRDLLRMVREGTFREDLYYRLKVVEIKLPPLRERREDIPLLIEHFVGKFRKEFNRKNLDISKSVRDIFMNYPWPGNVRELEHALEHAFILCRSDIITPGILPEEFRREDFSKVPSTSIRMNYEEKAVREALEEAKGNKAKAAKLLNMSRPTLYRKMVKYGIDPENFVFTFTENNNGQAGGKLKTDNR